MRRAGLTLVEVLLVMAILGIVLAVGYVSLRGWVLTNQVRAAATQVGSDLERLRSGAWKNSVGNSLTVNTGGASYVLSLNGVSSTVTLPYSATLSLDSGTSLSYTAPYGEYQAASRTLTVSLPNNLKSVPIYIVGVTGKVIQ